MSALVSELRRLVPRLYEVERAYARALGIDDGVTFEESVQPPAGAEQIAALERRLGAPLPPSYRAFLSLWDGARFDLGGGAAILGTADHGTPLIQSRIADKRALFAEFAAGVDPFRAGAIPFLLGDSRNMVIFEPPVRPDGEMDLVSYHLTKEEHRDPDVVAFFARAIAALEAAAPPPKKKKTRKRSKRT
jgi:hypothetical protein